MTGLERIVDRILADAKASAIATIEAAQSDCREVAEQYKARADETREKIAERSEREGESIIARARSSAAMTRRNLLLAARGALIDEAFDRARAEIRDTDYGKYRELLTALLSCALISQAEAEKSSLALGDEVAEVTRYEVLMNGEDRERYGAAVVEAAKRNVSRRVGAETAEKLCLSRDTVPIDGGLVLRFGDVEANCSLSMLIAEMRGALESKVAAVLFDDTPAAEEKERQ